MLLFLAGVVALSCVPAVIPGSHGALARTARPGMPLPYSFLSRVHLSGDRGVDCMAARRPGAFLGACAERSSLE